MRRGEHILALDVGASNLKLAEFVALKGGGIELVNFGIAPLETDSQSDTGRAALVTATLREIMRDRGITGRRVLLSVSGQSVFSRFVKLPPVDQDKVYQIILYEAQQNVPFPIEEVVWDYQLIGGAEGELDVMLAAIKADLIVELTTAVEEAGLETDLVDVAPMALYNAVRYNYPDLPECTLVVDIGARSTDLIFMEPGRVFSRSIPVAGNAITQQIMQEFGMSMADAEELKKAHAFVAFGGAYEGPKSEVVDKVSKSVRSVMTRLHAEINRSINFYRSQQSGKQPSLILLTGGTSAIPYTDAFLKEKMKVEVDYFNPFLNVAVSERISAEEVARYASQMGQVVGLALRRVLTCPIELNLLPPAIQSQKVFRRRQPYFLASGVALLLTLGIWSGYFLRMTRLAEARLQRVRERVRVLEQVERRLSESESRLATLQDTVTRLLSLGERRTQWLQVLAQIQAAMPDGVWLVSLKPITERPPEGAPEEAPGPQRGPVSAIEVHGLVYQDKLRDGDAVSEFRRRLREQPMFSPEKTDISWRPAGAADDVVSQFKIRIVLKEPLGT